MRGLETGGRYNESTYENRIIKLILFSKKKTKKFAYMQFLLYLCNRNVTNRTQRDLKKNVAT